MPNSWPLLQLTVNPISEILKEQRKNRLNLSSLPTTWKIVFSFPTAWIKKWGFGLSVNCFLPPVVRRLFWHGCDLHCFRDLCRSEGLASVESRVTIVGGCREDGKEVAVVDGSILWPFWESYCISLSPQSPSLRSSLGVRRVNVSFFLF